MPTVNIQMSSQGLLGDLSQLFEPWVFPQIGCRRPEIGRPLTHLLDHLHEKLHIMIRRIRWLPQSGLMPNITIVELLRPILLIKLVPFHGFVQRVAVHVHKRIGFLPGRAHLGGDRAQALSKIAQSPVRCIYSSWIIQVKTSLDCRRKVTISQNRRPSEKCRLCTSSVTGAQTREADTRRSRRAPGAVRIPRRGTPGPGRSGRPASPFPGEFPNPLGQLATRCSESAREQAVRRQEGLHLFVVAVRYRNGHIFHECSESWPCSTQGYAALPVCSLDPARVLSTAARYLSPWPWSFRASPSTEGQASSFSIPIVKIHPQYLSLSLTSAQAVGIHVLDLCSFPRVKLLLGSHSR